MILRVNVLSSIAIFIVSISTGRAYAASLSNSSSPNTIDEIETIAGGLTVPYEIAVQGSNLVVTTNGALVKVDESGVVTTITDLAAGPPAGVLVFEDDYVVVEYATGSLLRVSEDGTEISTLATNLGLPVGVARQGNDFIVVDIGTPDDTVIGKARLLRVSLDGDVSVIASENLGAPAAVFVDGDNFWLTDFNLGRLLLVSPAGEVTTVATDLGQPLDIDFDGSNFIITDFARGFEEKGKGRILGVSKTGKVTTLFSGLGNPSGLAIQKSDLIFSDVVEGSLTRLTNFTPRASVPEPSSVLGLLALGLFGAGVRLKSKLE